MKRRTAAPVDRTKPSTACEPCRKRRAKCDRRRPQCSQCIRSGNVCLGYRDNLDLVIRNQNEKVFKAAQKKAVAFTRSRSTSVLAAVKPLALDEARDTPHACARAASQANRDYIPWILQHAIGGLAVNYFITDFGHGLYLDWLPTLFRRNRQSLMLEASLEAVGILYLSLREHRPALMQKATSKYSVALRQISCALSIPSRAVEDDTIAAVLLVALFAAWSSPASEAACHWTYHVNGAMSLLDLRSVETFDGYVIQWLLGHVIAAVQLDCITHSTSLPPQLSKLCKLSVQANWDFQVSFWLLIEGIADLRQSVVQNRADYQHIVSRATGLDAQAARLARTMPLPPELEPVPSPHRIKLDDCPVDLAAHRIVQALNTLRLIRLEANRLIIQQPKEFLDTTPFSEAARSKAADTIMTVVQEIIESVPRFLHFFDKPSCPREDLNLWICSLLYALAFAADCEVVSEDLKNRIRRQLSVFAEKSDMPHVAKAALEVASGQQLPEGLHIFYLC